MHSEGIRQRYSSILAALNAKDLGSSVASLFAACENPLLKSIIPCYADLAHAFVVSIAATGGIGPGTRRQLAQLRRQVQDQLDRIWAPVPKGSWDQLVLDALDAMGGLKVLPGRPAFCFFIMPELLPLAFRLLSRLDAVGRKKHVRELAALRGLPAPTNQQVQNLDDEVLKPLADALQLHFKRSIASSTRYSISVSDLELVRVEYLPTATQFYEGLIAWFKDPKLLVRPSIFFGNTSAVILPEERFGADYFRHPLPINSIYDESLKNPLRREALDSFANAARMQRYYYFNLERTAEAYRKTAETIREAAKNCGLDPEQAAAQYAEDARKSLVSFLQRKNFGISAVTAFPEEFNYLTVGNGTSALLSIRDPIGNVRIGHGFILRPTAALRAFIQEALSPERLIRELLPRGPDEPTRMLGSALLRAFAAPVAGTWRGLSAARRRERVLDMAGRITDAIRKGQIGVEVFKVPGAKTSGFRQIADQILARVTQSELPRPQKGKRE